MRKKISGLNWSVGEIMRRNTLLYFILRAVMLFLATFSVFAQPLDNYCLSKIGHKPETYPKSNTDYRAKPLSILVQGKKFSITTDYGTVSIMDENNKALSSVSVWQGDSIGDITELTLMKNDWLWIDGFRKGYIAKLNTSNIPPTLETPMRISNLAEKPTSKFLAWLDGDYNSAPGFYSPSLNRIFVTGYPIGSSAIESREIIDGKVKYLPENLQGSHYYADLPSLNGVLFKGEYGKVLFYDGIHVTTLLSGTPNKKSVWKAFYSWLFNPYYEEYVLTHQLTPLSKRFFLKGNYSQKPFFVEIKTISPLTPIFTDGRIWDFYEFPQDKQLFILTEHAVMAETKEGIQTVIKASAFSLFLFYSADEPKQASDGTILWRVYNSVTKKDSDYFIVRKLSSTNCFAPLDPKKPITLDNP